jgi:hypothetical protein
LSRTTHDIAPDPGALEALLRGRLGDPFSVLGPHRGRHGTVIRTFQPGAKTVEVHPLQKEEVSEPLQPIHPSGVFGGEVIDPGRYVLRVQWPETLQETEDPYSFGTLLGQRGNPSQPGTDARRTGDGAGRRPGRALCRLGAECASGLGGRRFQQLGRQAACDAPSPQRGSLGAVHPAASARHDL